MTSLSTVSAGAKPVTAFLDGQSGYVANNWSGAYLQAGALRYSYLAAGGVATPINITGSGVIQYLAFGADSTSTSANMTITIDGVEALNDTRTAINYNGIVPVGAMYQSTHAVTASLGYAPFMASLVVTVECNVNAYLSYNYYLT